MMLGHYFFFLSHLNRFIFTFYSALIAYWNKASFKNVDDMGMGMLFVGASMNMTYPLCVWLSVKFHYFLPMEVSFYTVANLIEPVVYFFTKYRCGKIENFFT